MWAKLTLRLSAVYRICGRLAHPFVNEICLSTEITSDMVLVRVDIHRASPAVTPSSGGPTFTIPLSVHVRVVVLNTILADVRGANRRN